MKKSTDPTRRAVLRGAGGIAISLPFLDSLAPRSAQAQGQVTPRFVPIYFPGGASTYWRPVGAGPGAAWVPSPILAPLAPLKEKLTVLSNVDNAGPFAADVTPAQTVLAAAFLNCARPVLSPPPLRGAISADQLAAQKVGQSSPVRSLQLGLATQAAPPAGLPEALSRTISWSPDSFPLQRVIDPQAVFDRLVGVAPDRTDRPQRPFGPADRSVLDYVTAETTAMAPRLGRADKLRLDAFLGSVREAEKSSIDVASLPPVCRSPLRPQEGYRIDRLPAEYSRDKHADTMIDLMVLALQCNLTQVISLMLDDPPSTYPYSFLKRRDFSLPGAPQTASNVSGNLQGLSTVGADVNDWSTVTHWMMEKVARLCTKLMAIPEGPATLLDSTVVWVGSEVHGDDRAPLDLPLFYVGSGGRRLRVNEHVVFPNRCRLSDLYRTVLDAVFTSPVATFGDSSGIIRSILV